MKLHDLWKPIPAKPAQPAKTTRTGVQPARPPQPEKPPPKPHPPVPPKPPQPPQPPKDGGEYKPVKQVKQLKHQSRASKRPGRSRRRWRRSVRVGMGTALLRVMRGIVAPAHGTGPTAPRPPLRACPRHPPLGLGTRWSGRWVLLPARNRSAWRSVVLLVGRDPGVPGHIAPAPRKFFPIPARASLTNPRRAGQS